MRYAVRWTEELLMKALFDFHPALANAGLIYDGTEEHRSDYTIEGGDVLILRPDLLVVGFPSAAARRPSSSWRMVFGKARSATCWWW